MRVGFTTKTDTSTRFHSMNDVCEIRENKDGDIAFFKQDKDSDNEHEFICTTIPRGIFALLDVQIGPTIKHRNEDGTEGDPI